MELYHASLLSRNLMIPNSAIGSNIHEVLMDQLSLLEGQCLEEGYIKKGSINLVRYSCGVLKGGFVSIQVVFECMVSNPVPGQTFTCVVEHNTRAGIKGRLDSSEKPFVIFLARDHHHHIPNFADIKENEKIKVTVLGQRYEINDPTISIIAVLSDMYEPEVLVDDFGRLGYSKDEIPSPVYGLKKGEYVEDDTPPKSLDKALEAVDTPRYADKSIDKDAEDVFVFMSKSADVKPGKGKNEQVKDKFAYTELSKIPKWRSMLSNFDVAPFEWTGEDVLAKPFASGTRWNSIEHVFQGSKFRHYGFKEADKFTMNSGDPIGLGDGAMAQSKRKLKLISDMSDWEDLSWKVMASAARAKYTQNPDRLRILKLTGNAKLMHMVTQRGKPSNLVEFKHLEEIRGEL
jgi:predicted NAD-dependent protein-ADP-ribosyltransferase YbiA (DUF1768 family)/DNA-directed RNA polymerase subunit E'/Rpb7